MKIALPHQNGMAALDDECIEVIEGYDGTTDEAVKKYLMA